MKNIIQILDYVGFFAYDNKKHGNVIKEFLFIFIIASDDILKKSGFKALSE
ncbi:MAG: hypothetical protein MJB14_11405 [Spirochaetes bacterium]|nr:hypothetical protein [Spirochaetota bacterium]